MVPQQKFNFLFPVSLERWCLRPQKEQMFYRFGGVESRMSNDPAKFKWLSIRDERPTWFMAQEIGRKWVERLKNN